MPQAVVHTQRQHRPLDRSATASMRSQKLRRSRCRNGRSRSSERRSKLIKRYRHEDVKTPLACLRLLCDKGLARLKVGVTLAALQAPADAQTDLAAAQEMQRAKAELFELFNRPRPRSAQPA